ISTASVSAASTRGLRLTVRGGPKVARTCSVVRTVSSSVSCIKCISHPSHDGGHLLGLLRSRVTAGTQPSGGRIQHPNQIVNTAGHILGFWSGGTTHRGEFIYGYTRRD